VMEQRVVVRFLIRKKLSARDIKEELEGVYGHEALSLSAVKKWRPTFINGRITLEDDSRSGSPLEAIFPSLCRRLLMKASLFHARACVKSCESETQSSRTSGAKNSSSENSL
jgi:hypothetical protein